MSTLTPPSVDLDISKDVSLQLGKDNVVAVVAASVNLTAHVLAGTSLVVVVDKASNP